MQQIIKECIEKVSWVIFLVCINKKRPQLEGHQMNQKQLRHQKNVFILAHIWNNVWNVKNIAEFTISDEKLELVLR